MGLGSLNGMIAESASTTCGFRSLLFRATWRETIHVQPLSAEGEQHPTAPSPLGTVPDRLQPTQIRSSPTRGGKGLASVGRRTSAHVRDAPEPHGPSAVPDSRNALNRNGEVPLHHWRDEGLEQDRSPHLQGLPSWKCPSDPACWRPEATPIVAGHTALPHSWGHRSGTTAEASGTRCGSVKRVHCPLTRRQRLYEIRMLEPVKVKRGQKWRRQ